MNLPNTTTISENQTILVRLDLDLPMESGRIINNSRLKKSISTLQKLLNKRSKLIIIGHLGRPGGAPNPALSLRPIYTELLSLLNSNPQITQPLSSVFLSDSNDKDQLTRALITNNVVMLENLRFYPGEELNSPELAANLASFASHFVNDSFGTAHRRHASVSGLKDLLPTFYGDDFLKEFKAITSLAQNLPHPATLILGGGKKDKLDYLPHLLPLFDHILIAGLLPAHISSSPDPKVQIATLNPDQQDMDSVSQAKFISTIQNSSSIVWAGPVSNYISLAGQEGNQKIALAVTSSSAYTLIGGGDTEASLSLLNLEKKVNFVSFAGGALLHLIAYQTLPAIKI